MARSVFLFLLGALAPIDVLGDLSPWVLDAARYILALALVIVTFKDNPSGSVAAKLATALLCLVSGISLLRSVLQVSSSGEFGAMVGLVSVVIAYLVTRDSLANRTLILGLLFGACLSALDIVLQLIGLPFLGVPTEWGIRYSGLSLMSTNTAPYLALGIVMVVSRFLWRSGFNYYLLRCLLLILLAVGLWASGGRGGLAGLVLALTIWSLALLRSNPPIGILVVITGTLMSVLYWERIWSFLDRSDLSNSFTSGRTAFNSASWDAFIQGGVLGVNASVREAHRPHTPILTFALDAGAIGLVTALILVSLLFWRMLRPAAHGAAGQLLSMMAAVLLVTSLLEPTGFFVGLSKAVILMIVVSDRGLSNTQIGRDSHLRANQK